MPTATRRRSTRAAKPVEPEVTEDLDLDPEDDDVEEEAPAPKRGRGRPAKSAAAPEKATRKEVQPETTTFGTAWLTEYVNDQLDMELDGKAIRVILRRMVADGMLPVFEGRYTFPKGENDRNVAKILKYVRENETEEADEEEKPAARRTKVTAGRTKVTAAKPATRRGRKPAVKPETDDDPDLPDDLDDIDDL